MVIKLIASDLDGTLLNPDSRLTDKNKKILELLIEKGIIFVPISGRVNCGFPQQICDIKGLRYKVCSNGGSIFDKNREIHTDAMSHGKGLEVISAVKDFDVCVNCYHQGRFYVDRRHFERLVEKGFRQSYIEYLNRIADITPSFTEFYKESGWELEKFNIIFHNPKEREKAFSIFENIKDIAVSSSSEINIEINNLTATKGNALRFLEKYFHIKNENMLIFGDNYNDMSMFDYAVNSVAMGNAVAEIKQKAKYIAKSNAEDGVYEFLSELFEIKL